MSGRSTSASFTGNLMTVLTVAVLSLATLPITASDSDVGPDPRTIRLKVGEFDPVVGVPESSRLPAVDRYPDGGCLARPARNTRDPRESRTWPSLNRT